MLEDYKPKLVQIDTFKEVIFKIFLGRGLTPRCQKDQKSPAASARSQKP
jgi:hypothetical protein